MKTLLHFLSTPETWPDWLAVSALAVMMNVLTLLYFGAWDTQF